MSVREAIKQRAPAIGQPALSIVLPVCALIIWFQSLHLVHVDRMNDLGLVSVLPPSIILSFVIMMVSFLLTLGLSKVRVPVLLLHFALLIFMLYGITNLVEEAPRFAIVYRHAGYTEYIMRTGGVAPDVDAYFSWPGFFLLSALATQLAGYHDILPFATWSAVFLNLLYLGPLYLLFGMITAEKRVVWLALWFFSLTNWIAQDYYSPQGFAFFLYLVILVVLLKWFQPSALAMPRQRALLLTAVITIFAFVVFSHPLTPFALIATVGTLVLFRCCTPRWLPLLMALMTALWMTFMTQSYLSGHLGNLLGEVGHVGGAISDNVTARVQQGNAQHTLIAELRLLMTLLIWGLAALGVIARLRRGYHDLTFVLLALAPFPLLLTQSYGGELLLRIYLFTLPPMVFFAASLFSDLYPNGTRGTRRWMRAALLVTTLVLLGGFLFTRYGNERMDYMTRDELAGMHYLYTIAPKNALLISLCEGPPWQFAKFEQYTTVTMSDDMPNASAVIMHQDLGAILRLVQAVHPSRTYIVFTRSERATAQATGLPPRSYDAFKQALIASGNFAQIYSNPDTQLLVFIARGSGHPVGKIHRLKPAAAARNAQPRTLLYPILY